MTPVKKLKTSPPPNNGELREEDDWTKVKDPKEKKRIQNRVAQRTYREFPSTRAGTLVRNIANALYHRSSHEGKTRRTPS